MRLVYEHQVVVWEVVKKRCRWAARVPARQVPRVVLDARAIPYLLQHLQVKVGALLQPLRLQQLSPGLKVREHRVKLFANRPDGRIQPLLAGDIVARRVYGHLLPEAQDLAGQQVNVCDALHIVTENSIRTACSPDTGTISTTSP